MENFIYAIFVFSIVSMVFIGFVLVKLLLNYVKDNKISRLENEIDRLQKRIFYLNDFINNSKIFKPLEVSIKDMEKIFDSKFDK